MWPGDISNCCVLMKLPRPHSEAVQLGRMDTNISVGVLVMAHSAKVRATDIHTNTVHCT